jgi:hypothetical protein
MAGDGEAGPCPIFQFFLDLLGKTGYQKSGANVGQIRIKTKKDLAAID